MADRIQARALDRIGELMKAIPASKGGRPSEETKLGTQLSLSDREQARIQAGLSKSQAKDAVSINNIPCNEFNAAVEGDNSPTAKALGLECSFSPL
jgi:hypothetical protein